jgi:hypothetical protein
VQPKTQASIDDQHSEAILGKLGEKSRLALWVAIPFGDQACEPFAAE